MFHYCKRLRNILEIPMLSEVNIFKDNPLLYFIPSVYFDPPFNTFSKSLKPPRLIWPPPPPFIMNLRVSLEN